MNPLTRTDRSFLKYFAILLAALHVVVFGCMGLAAWVYANNPPPQAPDANRAERDRIAPVGAVYSGNTGRAAMLAAAQKAQAAAAAERPFGGSTDGKVVFDGLCHACHATGTGGAPVVGNAAAWGPRIAKGEEVLVSHAIHGFTGSSGVMPPKGGNPNLGDEQVRNAVEWMMAQVK